MRTLSADESAKVSTGSYAPALRVSVEDSGGTFRDVDSYFGGQKFLVGVSLKEGVDDQGPTASITLKREIFYHSLSPLMLSSGPAKGYVPSASGVAPVALYRRVKVEWYVGAVDESQDSPSWTELFVGRIDSVAIADGENLTLECRDANVAVLSDSFFERERIYGLTPAAYAVQKGCFIWAAGEAQALGDLVVPSTLNGYLYRCTTAGTAGATEPSWPTTVGNTISDGSVVWTCGVATETAGVSMETTLQQMLNDSPVSLTLYAPDASSFTMNSWKQEREPILEAIRKVAQLIGWDVRPRYDSGGTYRFQLYKPDRTASTPARTFAASSYVDVSTLSMGVDNIRNVIKVVYSDSADLGTDGTPKRKARTATSTSSIAAYGRRYMEIAEESSSQVDTSAEADALAAAALADLALPLADLEVSAFFFPWVQVGDLYRFSANNIHFDTDQDLAVVGYSHEAQLGSDGEQTFRTTLTCRGKPSGGRDRWLQWDSRPGVAPAHSLQDSLGGTSLSVVAAGEVVGGARFKLTDKLRRTAKFDGYEIHISTSSGFTPSSGTLACVSKADTVEVGHLTPGTTYYARAIPRQVNAGRIVQGQPSAQVSFSAGLVTTAKLADLAVSSAKLADLAVTNGKIDALAVDSGKLAAAAVTTAKIATGAVTSNELGAGAVTTAKLATGAVTSNELGALAVTTAKIAAGAVTSNELGTGAVTNAKLGSLAVATGNIQAGAVTSNELGAGAVTNAKIGSLAVATGNIQGGAVTANELGALAVTAPKLDDGMPLAAYDEATVLGIWGRSTATNCTKVTFDGTRSFATFNVLAGATNPQVSTTLYTGTTTNALTTKAVMRYRFSGGLLGGYTKTLTAINNAATGQTASASFIADGAWHTAVFDISGWTTAGTLRIDLGLTALATSGAWDISYLGTGNPGAGTNALISYQGNVGVGVATPSTPIHVRGSGNLVTRDTGATTGVQNAELIQDGTTTKWQVGKDTDNSWFLYDAAGAKAIIRAATNGNVALQQTSGNVGFGIAPSAATYKVDIGGETSINPISLQIRPSGHATSRRAGFQFGSWLLGQDVATNGTLDWFIFGGTSAATRFLITAAGVVTVPQLAGTGNRAVYSDATGALTNSSSDESLKTNIESLTAPLDVVLGLRPVRFNWRDTDRLGAQREVGFIAQEVEPVLPEVVGRNADGTLTVDYAKVVAALTGAVQELHARLKQLEQQLAPKESAP